MQMLLKTVPAVTSLIFAMPAVGGVVYEQTSTPLYTTQAINSNVLANQDGSDQDVTVFDNFSLKKSAIISSLTWRGLTTNQSHTGFIVKIYKADNTPAAQPDTSPPLAVIDIEGTANEKPQGNLMSDFRAELKQPLALVAGKQYWISIVSKRRDFSPWGWATGTGGDGKSIQFYKEFKILPARGDRVFSLYDQGNE